MFSDKASHKIFYCDNLCSSTGMFLSNSLVSSQNVALCCYLCVCVAPHSCSAVFVKVKTYM